MYKIFFRMVARNRQKLVPWLREILDKNTVANVAWINKEESIFSIAWPCLHEIRQNEDCAKIFEVC